jgi:3'-5' exoribonuclease
MKTTFVNTLKAGTGVEDVFVLSEKSVALKKDGGRYLTIALTDRTGTVKGVVWDNVEHLADRVAAGAFVHIKGKVNEYRGALQLVVSDMQELAAEAVAPDDFLPVTPRNIEHMFERLCQITATIQTPHLKQLLDAFWRDEAWVAKFKRAPAAKMMHHAYIGGLLEHTLSMTSLAEKIAAHYGGVDRDLLLAGSVLHDIGKIEEFAYQHHIDYTDQGRLVSHIVIGIQMLEEKLRGVKDFPEGQAWLLKHMIISHHGSREFGSPEPPKTIEAVLLNYIDEIDAKVAGIRDFMADQDSDEPWTSYHRVLGRHFFKGGAAQES